MKLSILYLTYACQSFLKGGPQATGHTSEQSVLSGKHGGKGQPDPARSVPELLTRIGKYFAARGYVLPMEERVFGDARRLLNSRWSQLAGRDRPSSSDILRIWLHTYPKLLHVEIRWKPVLESKLCLQTQLAFMSNIRIVFHFFDNCTTLFSKRCLYV